MFKSQKGVSLFAVLMFMLVATIAGTATYKWLSSEGFSSADRMLVNEARTSSQAGVEAARAWMMYHANDVGSILQQYFSEDVANRNPISLDDFLKPMAKSGQSFSVALVGADAPTTSATYKLKIVSTGYAHNNAASYTETAILNVSGLYRVLKPVPEEEFHLDYHYAYFGGSTSFAGGHGVTSALINGDWGMANGSNPINLDGDFVVTGKVTLSGNKIKAGGTTCVGGNLDPNNGIWTKNLFVGGLAGSGSNKFVGNIGENAYFAGNLTIGNIGDPGFSVGGNMYLEGVMRPNLSAFQHSIGGNLCLGNSASIQFESESANHDFIVAHHVWMPTSFKNGRGYGLNTNNGISGLSHRQLGTSDKDTVYVKDAAACQVNVVPGVDNCNEETVNGKKFKKYYQIKGGNKDLGYAGFASRGIVRGTLPENPSFQCGKSVKNYCDAIWKPKSQTGKSCSNSPYYVSDILMTGWKKFEKYADTASKSGIPDCNHLNHISNDKTTKMNSCYEKLYNDKDKRKRYLFNDYLVLKLTFNENAAGGVNDASAPSLNGKFLFIYDTKFGGPNANHGRFPKTTPNSRVFVYLKDGADVHINCENDKSTRNYFFFTRADIKGFLGQCTWAGSVYATASSCAKIPDINGTVTMMYDEDVVDDIAQSGIVCPVADSAYCGDSPTSSSSAALVSSSSVGFVEGPYDPDFVAMGPQLYVTVESEYKSPDKIDEMNVVNPGPTIQVMPRVVYLNASSPGQLSDYITVIPRTGAPKQGGILSCDGRANDLTSGKVKDKIVSANLNTNVYNCSFTRNNPQGGTLKSDFYVQLLEGDSTTTPMVHFAGAANEFFQVGQSGSGEVKLVVKPSSLTGDFKIRIGMSDLPTGWDVRKSDNSNITWKQAADGSQYYAVEKPYSSVETTYPIFNVSVSPSALPGTVRFTLQNPEGCIVGGGSVIKAFNRRGVATIHRGSIADYCREYEEECEKNPKYKLAADSLENCPMPTPLEWVDLPPYHGCDNKVANERWECDAGLGESVKYGFIEGSFDRRTCVMYNPEKFNYVTAPKDDATNAGGYILYASLKRLHYMLHVALKNADDSDVLIDIFEPEDTTFSYPKKKTCSSSVGCDIIVYSGQNVRLTTKEGGDDRFARWSISDGSGNHSENSSDTVRFVMSDDVSYTAVFNERDPHCFYAEFNKTDIWCKNNKDPDCIDYCQGSMPCKNNDLRYENANWIVVNSNGGGRARPEIFSHKYLKRPDDGNVAMMMNTVDAGIEGTYNIQLWTDITSPTKVDKTSLNSGLVIRSNRAGTEYVSVNFFGIDSTGRNSTAKETFARVCYLTSVSMTETYAKGANCMSARLKDSVSGAGLSWESRASLNFDVTIYKRDSLLIMGNVPGASGFRRAVAKFDLKALSALMGGSLDDDEHAYVGLKLGDSDFGVYDVSWFSEQYKDKCYATPTITCSFAAKYMAGQVPRNEDVTPVIGYSKWFADKGADCVDDISYYYNGCDMPSGRYKRLLGAGLINGMYCGGNIGAEGYVESGLVNDALELRSGNFYFKYEGDHGFQHDSLNGAVRNASVRVYCMQRGKVFTAGCGEFYVGQKHTCVQNERLAGTTSGITGEHKVVLNREGGVNLRDARVMFYVTMDAGTKVTATFKDVSGKTSDAVNLEASAVNDFENKDFASRYGFDPEHVKEIILRSGFGTYTIDSITSQCSATLSVNCGDNDVTYTPAGQWRISTNIDPFQIAKKCKVESLTESSLPTYFGPCNSQGIFLIDDPNFEDRLYEGTQAQQYSFKVSVYDDDAATELTPPTSECTATSMPLSPVSLNCRLDGPTTSFAQGGGVPAVVVEANNCPAGGCVYDLTLSDGTEYAHSSTLQGSMSWAPSLNTATAMSAGTYSYTVTVYNATKTKVYGSCTSGSFEIIESIPASASECKITPQGHFTAFVSGGNMGNVAATLTRSDLLGNVLGQQNVAANSNAPLNFDLHLGEYANGTYDFILSLNGDPACTVTHTVNNVNLTLTCPSPTTGQNPESPIVVSPNVSGCDGECEWKIKKGPTVYESGSGYTSGNVSFYDQSGTGEKDYQFNISRDVNGVKVSKECTFKVTFAGVTSITPCHGDNLSAGKYSLTGWGASCSWCGTPTSIKVQSSGNNSANCLNWISGTNKKYGDNNQNNCYGTLNVTYPIALDIPAGHTLVVYCQPY